MSAVLDSSATSESRHTIKTFPCTSCGAKLSFKPGSKTLQCQYCGTENAIPQSDDAIEELDFEDYLRDVSQRTEKVDQEQVKCTSCGAEQTLPPYIAVGECAFCHSPLTSKTYANRIIKPRALVPFRINKEKAQDEFRKWLHSLWLAPSNLKKFAQSDSGLRGLYIPYWTYDCNTYSDYSGQRGDDYQETERVQVQNSNGEWVTETRTVTKTRWSRVSGHVERFHDDVLVLASTSFKDNVRAPISGWNLKALVPYQDQYMAGFTAEAYRVDLPGGFRVAKPIVDGQVAQAIRADIGGDRQQIDSVRTDYADITFKHVLLPIWISSYRYGDKFYRFMINGQTGEVSGESPKSAWKIALLAIGIVIALMIVLALIGGGRR